MPAFSPAPAPGPAERAPRAPPHLNPDPARRYPAPAHPADADHLPAVHRNQKRPEPDEYVSATDSAVLNLSPIRFGDMLQAL